MKFVIAILAVSVLAQGISAVGSGTTTTATSPQESPGPVESPSCVAAECCDVQCARNFLHRDIETSAVDFFTINGDYPDMVQESLGNPFLSESCKCDVANHCDVLCRRNCSVETVPNLAPAKSLFISDQPGIEQFALNVGLGLGVCTICFTPLAHTECNRRRADYEDATCLLLKNCPMLPHNNLFIKFDDVSDVSINFTSILVGVDEEEDAAVVTLKYEREYFVTSCCNMQTVGHGLCTDHHPAVRH